jgi:acyl carrier protein
MTDSVEHLAAVVSRELNVELSAFSSDVLLREDLGMDSIIALNLMFALERELAIRIREEDIVRIRTVGDLNNLLFALSRQSTG